MYLHHKRAVCPRHPPPRHPPWTSPLDIPHSATRPGIEYHIKTTKLRSISKYMKHEKFTKHNDALGQMFILNHLLSSLDY